jgi:hypothetical protein
MRAFDTFADLDRVGEHAHDTIDPGDLVALPSMTRQAVGAVDFAGIE